MAGCCRRLILFEPCHRACKLVVVLVLLAIYSPVCPAENERPVVTIAIVEDGVDPQGPADYGSLVDLIIRETTSLLERDFDVRFPASKRFTGDWTEEGIHVALDRALADEDVAFVISFGFGATFEACRRTNLPKPVIAPLGMDIEAQELPHRRDERGRLVSGVANLNYLTRPGSLSREMMKFKDVVRFSTVHVLSDPLIAATLPDIEGIAATLGERLGAELTLVPVLDTAEQALAQLPPDAEAVLVAPLYRLSAQEFDRLVAGLIRRRLPSFSLLGPNEVRRGIMMSLRGGLEFPRLARQVAVNVQRILLGDAAADLPIVTDQPEQLTFNMATIRAIEFPIKWSVLVEAEVLHENRVGVGPRLTLDEAVREAMAANVRLDAQFEATLASRENIEQARAAYKPFVDVSASYVQVDDDRASRSFGALAERTLGGSLALSQLIYSDRALANIRIQREIQQSRELDVESLQLNVALDAAVAFLDVLRAELLERIFRDNLRLTESNLELARRRVAIGFSGPADVYRWESRLASSRSALLAAVQRTERIRLILNQLLNRPQLDRFSPQTARLEDPRLLSGFVGLQPYIETVPGGELFETFLVQQGLSNSPELRGIDALIAARERTAQAARRAYWAPEVGLFAQFDTRLGTSGAGSDPAPLPGVEDLDEHTWRVGVSASLPLYAGGLRASVLRQAQSEVASLMLERLAFAQEIELAVRLTMSEVRATFPAIGLSREASAASAKNLALVTESYERGVVSIIDLLDAQDTALSDQALAVTAEFDFLTALMGLQRASNSFGFLMSSAGRTIWFERLQQFFDDAGWNDDVLGRPR